MAEAADPKVDMARAEKMELLKQRVLQLQVMLDDKDSDLHTAAKIGQQLLTENSELTKQLEDLTTKSSNRLEALEQEKYNLMAKLKQKANMEEEYLSELESMKKILNKQNQDSWYRREAELLDQLDCLKKRVSGLQNEYDQTRLNEEQGQEKVSQLEAVLKDLQDQLQQQRSAEDETFSDEIAAMNNEIANLRDSKAELVNSLQEAERKISKTELSMRHLQQEIEEKSNDVDEARKQAMAYFKALEESREEIQELKVEVDLLKMEAAGHKKKGNSLFSEVEDRRVQAEKELLSMRVKHETLEKRFQMSQQSLHRLKVQMAEALNRTSGKADQKFIESLKSQLSQAKGLEQRLMQKINDLEEDKKSLWQQVTDKSGSQPQGLATFLQAQLEKKEKEIEKVENELKAQRMIYLMENTKVIEGQRRIYLLEQELDHEKGNNRRLFLKLEELQLKYEPEKMNVKGNKVTKVKEVLKKTETEADALKVLKESTHQNSRTKTGNTTDSASGHCDPADESSELNKSKELSDLIFANTIDLPDNVFAAEGGLPTGLPKLEGAKAVRWSGDDDVINISGAQINYEEEDSENVPQQRVKGRKYRNTVKADPMFKGEECKVQ